MNVKIRIDGHNGEPARSGFAMLLASLTAAQAATPTAAASAPATRANGHAEVLTELFGQHDHGACERLRGRFAPTAADALGAVLKDGEGNLNLPVLGFLQARWIARGPVGSGPRFG
ncbi:hypothetical protein [Sphingomonas sp.]|uniref:hypothetical protein n=1 Tax=Sphingomonas sp. TaxID=28214 RepID=UPI003B3A1B71